MLNYQYDREGLEITETQNGKDIEFVINIKNHQAFLKGMHQVRNFFESNKVYTDVLFYSLSDHRYRIIVRHDYYIDFLLVMFKNRLLLSLSWDTTPTV